MALVFGYINVVFLALLIYCLYRCGTLVKFCSFLKFDTTIKDGFLRCFIKASSPGFEDKKPTVVSV